MVSFPSSSETLQAGFPNGLARKEGPPVPFGEAPPPRPGLICSVVWAAALPARKVPGRAVLSRCLLESP